MLLSIQLILLDLNTYICTVYIHIYKYKYINFVYLFMYFLHCTVFTSVLLPQCGINTVQSNLI